MAYDKKFKQSVLAHMLRGNTQATTAELFGISTTTLKEWKKRNETGQSLDAKIRVRPPKKIEPEKLREYIKEHPDDYLSEIAEVFHCSVSAVHSALKRLKITRKKRPKSTASGTKTHV